MNNCRDIRSGISSKNQETINQFKVKCDLIDKYTQLR